MAAPLRLTFLYPHLYRSIRNGISTTTKAVRSAHLQRPRIHAQKRRLTACTTRQDPVQFVQRHGKAVEPYLPPGLAPEDVKIYVREGVSLTEHKASEIASKTVPENRESSKATTSHGISSGAQVEQISSPIAPPADSEPLSPRQQAAVNTADPTAPLEQILHMGPPGEPPIDPSIPHLHAPPYVHHFDSYTLVKQVEEGGFENAQAITAMKAVRGLLAQNLEIAKEGLISKGDVENETYLFRAACSELRTEIQNGRRASEEKMRRERTLLQHEVDILSQKMTQDLLALKDDLRGMFNDRKLIVREEQRAMESKIQEISYRITVALNSDAKSEVEGLRWVLTRRSVLGIIFMAFMVLSSLRYASYRAHEEEMERKRIEKQREMNKRMGHRYVDGGVQTEDGLIATTAAEALAAN